MHRRFESDILHAEEGTQIFDGAGRRGERASCYRRRCGREEEAEEASETATEAPALLAASASGSPRERWEARQGARKMPHPAGDEGRGKLRKSPAHTTLDPGVRNGNPPWPTAGTPGAGRVGERGGELKHLSSGGKRKQTRCLESGERWAQPKPLALPLLG